MDLHRLLVTAALIATVTIAPAPAETATYEAAFGAGRGVAANFASGSVRASVVAIEAAGGELDDRGPPIAATVRRACASATKPGMLGSRRVTYADYGCAPIVATIDPALRTATLAGTIPSVLIAYWTTTTSGSCGPGCWRTITTVSIQRVRSSSISVNLSWAGAPGKSPEPELDFGAYPEELPGRLWVDVHGGIGQGARAKGTLSSSTLRLPRFRATSDAIAAVFATGGVYAQE